MIDADKKKKPGSKSDERHRSGKIGGIRYELLTFDREHCSTLSVTVTMRMKNDLKQSEKKSIRVDIESQLRQWLFENKDFDTTTIMVWDDYGENKLYRYEVKTGRCLTLHFYIRQSPEMRKRLEKKYVSFANSRGKAIWNTVCESVQPALELVSRTCSNYL